MDLDDKSVGACGNSRLRQCPDVLPVAGCMARVCNDRQMRKLLYHRYSTDIYGVPRRRLICAYAPLAQYDVFVAGVHYILRCHEPFFYRGGQAAFEQYRLRCEAYFVQQPEILHVSCAYLDNVGIRSHQSDIAGVDDLGNDLHACDFTGFCHDFQPFFLEPLEGIRRRARLECSSSQDACSRFLHPDGCFYEGFLAFYGTWPGNDGKFGPAEPDPADIDDAWSLLEFPAGKFERFHDRDYAFDSGHRGDIYGVQ